jgi:L-rhamnose mutarotase
MTSSRGLGLSIAEVSAVRGAVWSRARTFILSKTGAKIKGSSVSSTNESSRTNDHDSIPQEWAQLVDEIRKCGIAQITTFQNGLDLFLYSQIIDEDAWNKLWNSEIHRKWAELMEPLMHLDENGIVQAGELTEIFHLETRPE